MVRRSSNLGNSLCHPSRLQREVALCTIAFALLAGACSGNESSPDARAGDTSASVGEAPNPKTELENLARQNNWLLDSSQWSGPNIYHYGDNQTMNIYRQSGPTPPGLEDKAIVQDAKNSLKLANLGTMQIEYYRVGDRALIPFLDINLAVKPQSDLGHNFLVFQNTDQIAKTTHGQAQGPHTAYDAPLTPNQTIYFSVSSLLSESPHLPPTVNFPIDPTVLWRAKEVCINATQVILTPETVEMLNDKYSEELPDIAAAYIAQTAFNIEQSVCLSFAVASAAKAAGTSFDTYHKSVSEPLKVTSDLADGTLVASMPPIPEPVWQSLEVIPGSI